MFAPPGNTRTMRVSDSSAAPSAIGATASGQKNTPVKVQLIKADREAGVQAALAGRSHRPSPLQGRQAGLQSITNLSQQLDIDLPGRAIQLRPAMPAPNR